MIKFSIAKKQQPHEEVGRPWYDTKAGIAESLASLAAFKQMFAERHEAGYEREERLNDFYVLGRYSLDTCGNCMKAQGFIPKEVYPDIPDVLTREEFWSFIKGHSAGDGPMLSFGMGSDLPYPHLICSHCQRGWDMTNYHDTVAWHLHETYSLADFVGKTLAEMKAAYCQRNDAIYFMQPDVLIRNDRFIDRSPKYHHPEKDWQKGIVKNEKGWMSEKDGITDEYVIQPGDEGHFNVWKYFHHECNKKHLAAEEQKYFREIFEKAGFKEIRLTETPNQYCPCEKCAPWYHVATKFGTFLIGWRKRVINIDWSNVIKTLKQRKKLPKKSIASLFNGENVTKGSDSIHAWGKEKAVEYLTLIYSRLVSGK
jgi:hypothetical protein